MVVMAGSSAQLEAVGVGSRSSTKIVLSPVRRAQPATLGTIAACSPTAAALSTRPSNRLPMMLSCTNSSPIASRPRAASCAMRAEVPVPHGLRSIAFSP